MRASGRSRRLLVVVVVVAALGTGGWMLTRSPLLDVDRLLVRGNTRVTSEEVLAASGLETGDALAWIDLDAVAARIEQLPWVRGAAVRRDWPDTVRVVLQERVPVAWVDTGAGSALVVDRHGRALALESPAPPGLPQLLGVPASVPVGATIDGRALARVAGALLTAALPALTIGGTGHVTLVVASGQEVRLGRPTRIAAKSRAAMAVLAAPQAAGKTYVDVSAPSNPVAG